MTFLKEHAQALYYLGAFLCGCLLYSITCWVFMRRNKRMQQRALLEEWTAQRSLFVEVRQVRLDAPCTLVLFIAVYNVSPWSWLLQAGTMSVRVGTGNNVRLPINGAEIAAKTYRLFEASVSIQEPQDAERWLPLFIDDVLLHVIPTDGTNREAVQWRRTDMLWCVAVQREIRGVKAPPKPAGPGSAE